jgi:hypothetical protein
VVREVAEEYGKEHAEKDGKPREVLKSLTTFVGGGGPRFWFSVSPELQQLNYAQVIIEVNDKHDTNHLIGPIQRALDERIPWRACGCAAARYGQAHYDAGRNPHLRQ